MSKIKGKPGLIPEKRTIHGKKTTYQAIRYISTGDLKKRAKEFLAKRKRTSYVTRYIKKHFEDVDILFSHELESVAKESKLGEKYYAGYNLKNIKRVIEFKYPEVIKLIRIVYTNDGYAHLKATTERDEKNAKKRFKRSAKVGPQIATFVDNYKKLLKEPGTGFDKQLGTVLGLMHQHVIRVGAEDRNIEDKIVKITDLKPRMVVSHSSWKLDTFPHVVVEKKMDDGIKMLFLRSIDKQDNAERLTQTTSRVNSLVKKVVKNPDDLELKKELETLSREKKILEDDILVPLPKNYSEMIKLGHFGTTQLRVKHVKFPVSSEVRLDFIGKSAVRWNLKIDDSRLMTALRELSRDKHPEEELFPDIKYRHVKKILTRYHVLPKDFRSYEGTKTFTEVALKYVNEKPTTKRELSKLEKKIFVEVAKKLGNTPSMAKNKYTDPIVRGAWYSGLLDNILNKVKKSFVILVDLIKGVGQNARS